MEDKKGLTPTHWANKYNRREILELLLANGGVSLDKKSGANARQTVPAKPLEKKERTNERKIPRRYLLTVLKEDGHYMPMND